MFHQMIKSITVNKVYTTKDANIYPKYDLLATKEQ